MAIFRKGAASLTTLLIFAFGCGPVVPISDQGTASVVHDGKDPLAAAMDSANLQRFEATIDPRTKTVDVQRVGFQTKTTNIYVASLNAKWNAPVFSFDLVVWNYNPSPLPNVTGVVLSTTPTAPTVSLIGTSGTTSDGYPYYDYGTIAAPEIPVVWPPPPPLVQNYVIRNWQFSDPSGVPFKFAFMIRTGAADAGAAKNHVPAIASVIPASPTIPVNGSTSVTAVAADPNGDPLTYTWTAPAGGTITGTGPTVTFTAAASPGVYPIQLVVDDGRGGSDQKSGTVSVSAGSGDGTAQGLLSFGAAPPLSSDDVRQIDIELLNGPIVFPGGQPQQPRLKATAWNANHTQVIPTIFTWSQTGSTVNNWLGSLEQVAGNEYTTWFTRYGFTRSGSPRITVRAANGVTRSIDLNIQELPPTVQFAMHSTSAWPVGNLPFPYISPMVTISRATQNVFTVFFEDANGNWSGSPTATISPNNVPFTTLSAGPSGDSYFRKGEVWFAPGAFPGPGTWTLTCQQATGTGAVATHTYTITVN